MSAILLPPLRFVASLSGLLFAFSSSPLVAQDPPAVYVENPVAISGLNEPVESATITPGATIHYTLDGSTPTTSSPIWTGPQILPPGAILTTLAVKGEMDAAPYLVQTDNIKKSFAKFQQIGGSNLTSSWDVTVSPTGEVFSLSNGYVYKIEGDSATRLRQVPGNYDLLSHHPALGFVFAKRNVYIPSTNYFTILPDNQSYASPKLSQSPIWDIIALKQNFLYCTEPHHSIRSNRVVGNNISYTTFAGSGNRGYKDGVDTSNNPMAFNEPSGIASTDHKNFYVSERAGHRVRQITIVEELLGRNVTTYAGNSTPGWADGPKAHSRFESPSGIAVDRIGNVYVHDGPTTARRIRKISADGWVSTLHGPVLNQNGEVVNPEAGNHVHLWGMDIDTNGILYYADGKGLFKVTQDDWDNDGIPDEIERQLGAPYVVGVDDRKVDSDGDGFSNVAEWIAGTNPADAADKPAGQSALRHENNSIHLLFPATPGSTREVEYSDDLETWYPTGPVTTSEQPTHTASENMPAGVPARFYRMKETR